MVLPNYAARRRGGRKQCAANVVLSIITENFRNCKLSFVLSAVKDSTKKPAVRSRPCGEGIFPGANAGRTASPLQISS